MDEMKIHLRRSSIIASVLSRMLSNVIFKKTGLNVFVYISEFDIEKKDGELIAHANVNGSVNENDLPKLMSLLKGKES